MDFSSSAPRGCFASGVVLLRYSIAGGRQEALSYRQIDYYRLEAA